MMLATQAFTALCRAYHDISSYFARSLTSPRHAVVASFIAALSAFAIGAAATDETIQTEPMTAAIMLADKTETKRDMALPKQDMALTKQDMVISSPQLHAKISKMFTPAVKFLSSKRHLF